ncbi:MAG: adenylate kinase [Candidatus Thorarchaeota archaeon]
MVEASKLAIVGGVPGVGKTTVINKTMELAQLENTEIKTIVFGTVMMNIARENHNVHHRDDLRKLPPQIQRDIQREAAVMIHQSSLGHLTIVDTHYAIKIDQGYYLQGLPKWVSDELKPNLLILIETLPEDIAKRRNYDVSRNRDEEDIEQLRQHQEINRTIAATISQNTGALLGIVVNMQGEIDSAGKQLYNHLKRL